MDYPAAYELYLGNLYASGKSANTIKSAEQALRLLGKYLRGNKNVGQPVGVGQVVPTDLSNTLAGIGPIEPATHNRYRSVFVSFFDYCVMRGWSQMNPAKQLPTRRVIEQSNLILTPDQMLGMLDDANPVERIALALGMNTALRASDVSALYVGDVDLNSLTLRTKIQKTGGYDEKPITAQLYEELERWFREYNRHRHDGLQDSWRLVPSYNKLSEGMYLRVSSPMTHLHRIVQRALARLNLDPQGEGFHTLRRSAARALFEKLRNPSMGWSIKDPLSSAPRDHWCEAHQTYEQSGHDIVLDRGANYDHALLVVKEFLNHKSVEQTQRYLGINHERQIRDELLRGKDFLVPTTAPVCTAGLMDGINQRHGLAFDNPERIY